MIHPGRDVVVGSWKIKRDVHQSVPSNAAGVSTMLGSIFTTLMPMPE
jgi:hypothetical protein